MKDSDIDNNLEPISNGFQSFENAAADIVLAASFNTSGTRIVICSADHKIRVYNIDQDNAWTLVDQWRGHDAEILDVSGATCSDGKMLKMRRYNGLRLAWVNTLLPLAVIISSKCGKKTHPSWLAKVEDSNASLLKVHPTTYLTSALGLRQWTTTSSSV